MTLGAICKWMIAKRLFETKATNQQSKHCASILVNGKVIFYGENHNRGSGRSCHAELDAIKKFNNRVIKRFDLLVLCITNSGKLRNSKPCSHCLIRIQKLCGCRIRNILYSTNEDLVVSQKFSKLENHHITRGNLTIELIFCLARGRKWDSSWGLRENCFLLLFF